MNIKTIKKVIRNQIEDLQPYYKVEELLKPFEGKKIDYTILSSILKDYNFTYKQDNDSYSIAFVTKHDVVQIHIPVKYSQRRYLKYNHIKEKERSNKCLKKRLNDDTYINNLLETMNNIKKANSRFSELTWELDGGISDLLFSLIYEKVM